MAGVAYFLVSFVIFQQKYGQDVPNTIVGIDRVLSDNYDNVQVLHKFKVTGDQKVLAIVKVSNFTALECIITKILDLGTIVVDTQPIITYESFARSLGVSEELTQPVNVVLRKENLYLIKIYIAYYGKTTPEYLAIRKRSAERILSSRINGELNAVLFKNLAEREQQMFLNIDDLGAGDVRSFGAPLVVENGANFKQDIKALEFLDDYAALICQKSGY